MHAFRSFTVTTHALALTLAILLAVPLARPQSVQTTTVTGTVYAANGAAASGSLQVSWPAFTTAAGQAIAAGHINVNIPGNGKVSVPLAPNVGASPAGLYYTAVYHLSDGTTSTEYWVVPNSIETTIGQIRSKVMPAAQAVQAVSKSYVDQSIQQAVSSQITPSGGTMTGPLYLAGDPTAPSQAANKHYVDISVSGALPIGGGTLSGPVTATKIGAVYQADQFSGADFGAQLQACINALDADYGGTCDARNFQGSLSMASNLTISTGNVTVNLPCSTIATAASIVVPAGTRNVTLHGCASRGTSAASGAQGGTVFLYSGSTSLLEVGDPSFLADTKGFRLDNAALNTTAAAAASAQAVALYRVQEISLSSLYLLGNGNQTAITLDGTGNYTGGTLEDLQITGYQTGISGIGHTVDNAATTDWLNASTFVRIHIDCPTSYGNPISGTTGIDLNAGDGNTITGGDVESCATALHLGPHAVNNTILGLRNENSTTQIQADPGSSYNNWITGGTMFTGKLSDQGTRNSFLDTFHRSFNTLNGDWWGSQQDATVTNHLRLGIGTGNERGLLDRYQTDYGYRWTTGLSDASSGEQYWQVLDELNSVYRLSIGQYNNGYPSTNNQTVLNAAGTGGIILNGSNNAGTGGVVIGSGGPVSTTVATIDKSGNAHFTGTLLTDSTAQSTGTMTVRNNANAEVDYYLWPGLTTSQKGSFTYKDFNGASQWYMVKDQSNNWALNSAPGGLDSFKAYQSTNSGDTYVNAANATGVVRINYEAGSGTAFNIYGGNSSTLYAGFTAANAIKFPGLAAASARNCVQIDTTGYLSNTGAPCATGVGTVNTANAGQVAYYTGNGTALSGTTTVPLTAGGTGATTAAAALANLSALPLAGGTLTGPVTATQFNGPVSGNVTGNVTGNVSGTAANVTGTVAVANGGTGATTASGALANILPGVTTDGANGFAVQGNATIKGNAQLQGSVALAAAGLMFADNSVQTTSQQGALTGSANDSTARSAAAVAQSAAATAESDAQTVITTANAALASAADAATAAQTAATQAASSAAAAQAAATISAVVGAIPANGATSTGTGSSNVVTFPGAVASATSSTTGNAAVGGGLSVSGVISGGAVASAAALRAYSWSQLQAMGQVQLAGYNSGSKLGGGTFRWTSTATTPDNCIYFAGADDSAGSRGVMARVVSDYVYPEMCGALGDGVTDDTGALQAWAALPWKKSLQRSTYIVTGTINLLGSTGQTGQMTSVAHQGIDAPIGSVIQENTDNIPIMTVYGSRGRWKFPELSYKNVQPATNLNAIGLMVTPYPGVGGLYIGDDIDIRVDNAAVGFFIPPAIQSSLAVDAAAQAASITVADAQTNALGAKPWMPQMVVQILLANGTWFRTRLNAVNGTTLTLTNALPSAANSGAYVVFSNNVQSGLSPSLSNQVFFQNTISFVEIYNPSLVGWLDRGNGTQNNILNIYVHGANGTGAAADNYPTTAVNAVYIYGRSQDHIGIMNIEHFNLSGSAFVYISVDGVPVIDSIHFEGDRLKVDGTALIDAQSNGMQIGSVGVTYCVMLTSDGLTNAAIFKTRPTSKSSATTSYTGRGSWNIGNLTTIKNIVDSTAQDNPVAFLVRDASSDTIDVNISSWNSMRDGGFYPVGQLVTPNTGSAPWIGNKMPIDTVAYGFRMGLGTLSGQRLQSGAGSYNVNKVLVTNGNSWVSGSPAGGVYQDAAFNTLLTTSNTLSVQADSPSKALVLRLADTAQNAMLNNLASNSWFRLSATASAPSTVSTTTSSWLTGRNGGDNQTNLAYINFSSSHGLGTGQDVTITGSANPGLNGSVHAYVVDVPSPTQIVLYIDSAVCTITPPATTSTCGTSASPIPESGLTVTVNPVVDVFVMGDRVS